MINFVGPAKTLTDFDVAQAALLLGCEAAVLRAIMENESNNNGFTDAGAQKFYLNPAYFISLYQLRKS